jgi:hypothetical protein
VEIQCLPVEMDFENDVKNSQGDRVRRRMPRHRLRREVDRVDAGVGHEQIREASQVSYSVSLCTDQKLQSMPICAAGLRVWNRTATRRLLVLPFDIAEVDTHIGLGSGVIEDDAASEFAGLPTCSVHAWAGAVVPTQARSLCAYACAYRTRS